MSRIKFFAVAAQLVTSSLSLIASAEENGSLSALVEKLVHDVHEGEGHLGRTSSISREIAELNDPAAIPTLIGIVDSDNSYRTIYGVGYFGLSDLTGVKHDEVHHGRWWKQWWAVNEKRFPKEV